MWNFQVKKLSGQRVLQLLLHSLLSGKELSFRILEAQFESPVYQSLLNKPSELHIDHSSLGTRLATIKPEYFKALFEPGSGRFSKEFSQNLSGRLF